MLLLETLGQSADPLGKAQNRLMFHTFEHFVLHAAAGAPFSSKVVLSLQSEAQTAQKYEKLGDSERFVVGRRLARGLIIIPLFID